MSWLVGAGGAVTAVFAAIRGLWSPCGLSMVSTLNPFSERSRGHRYPLTAAMFVAGATLGGAILGAIAAVGAMVWAWIEPATAATLVIAAGCCLIAAASDSSVVSWRLPLLPRQVNEQWVDRYRRWIYAAGFGLQIGVGVATYVMTAAVYLTFVLGVLTGSPGIALAVGILFGAVRGCAILVGGRADDPQRLRRLHARLDRLEPWSLRAVIAVELVSAAALIWAAHPWALLVLVPPAVIGALRVGGHRNSDRPAGTARDRWAGGRPSTVRRPVAATKGVVSGTSEFSSDARRVHVARRSGRVGLCGGVLGYRSDVDRRNGWGHRCDLDRLREYLRKHLPTAAQLRRR